MKQAKSDKKKKTSLPVNGIDNQKRKSSNKQEKSRHPSVIYLDDLPDVEVDENNVMLSDGVQENDFVLSWIDQGEDKGVDRWLLQVGNGCPRGSVVTQIPRKPLDESLNKKSRPLKEKTPVTNKKKEDKKATKSREPRVSVDGNDGAVSRYGRQQKRKMDEDYVTAWREREETPEEEKEEEQQPPPPKQQKISQTPKKAQVKEQIKSPLQKPQKKQSLTKTPPAAPPPTEEKNEPLDAGDVVWARLGGFPFWPSVIVPDFKSNPPVPVRIPEPDKPNKNQYHVLFLEDNGAHSWVAAKNVVRFLSPEIEDLQAALKRDKIYLSKNDKAFKVNPHYQERWNKALEEAKQWYQKPAVERRAYYCPYYDEMIAEDDEEITLKDLPDEKTTSSKKKKSLPMEVSQEKPSVPKRKAQSLPGVSTDKPKPKPKKIKAKGLDDGRTDDSSSPEMDVDAE